VKYLFAEWDKIKDELKDKFIFLFLDYDGTLTPIVDTPAKAIISKKTKKLLHKLLKSSKCKLAIISGRSLKDIKNKIGLKDIIYVGNHGLEIEGPKIKFEISIPIKVRTTIRQIVTVLQNKLSKIKGVIVEDKNLTLSVHYRLVTSTDTSSIKKIVNEITRPYLTRGMIKINPGKKVIEIKPPIKWDKGKVVLWLLRKEQFVSGENNFFSIYFGDDITDEDAFRVLKNKGLTIFVGRPKVSSADYYLKNTKEVTKFIKQILKLQENKIICQN